jgi:hypothetical protein
MARRPASPAAAQRCGGVPPRLEGRGVHRGGEAASSPGWPLAEVQASVKGVRGAVTRKEAALVGEAGRRGGEEAEEAGVAGVRGSRGSGSSPRAAPASRRAVLLRRLRAPPSPLLLLLLRLQVGRQGIGLPRGG